MLTDHKGSDERLFTHLSNHAFYSLGFQEKIAFEADTFFRVFQILCRFGKCSKKKQKIVFDFEIIAFELVTLNTCFY